MLAETLSDFMVCGENLHLLTDNELLAFHIKSAREQSSQTSDNSSTCNGLADTNDDSSIAAVVIDHLI